MAAQKTFLAKKTANKPKKSLPNYLKTMRKITNRINVEEVKKLNRSMRITFALNAHLCQQAENMLKSQWTRNNYTYPSLSELIRKGLEAYQNREIEISLVERDKHTPKREITVRFSLNPDLLNFYYSLPEGQRTAIIEESLRNYLERLGG
ncbi:MAG: hypothetical protein MRECE_1c091 [Mycoplasmataceae bacterium CE_OT135]|nr:MAG: hypothetical protein MRECE_1c076 [Mycoplasmataceae bacterium CE_OT135]KLL04333.1 MAG: hypothetical protein MRECE_1c091 [Mycoplasmataceae bacterium CE_OT135]